MSEHEDNPVIIDFESLPPPQVIEEVDYDRIIENIRAKFNQLAPEYAHLYESDPINKVFEAFAYREFYLRQRINASIRAYMLPFSAEDDLDMLGQFYEVERNVLVEEDSSASPPVEAVMEGDASYRARIRDKIQGWSTAGGRAHYRFWARDGIGDVQDVRVYSPEGGLVRISILSRLGDGTPSQELLDQVTAQVARDDVKMLTDTVEVVPAVKVAMDVTAVIWLREDTPFRIYEELVDNFATSFKNNVRLGRDITRRWLVDMLFTDGVYDVDIIEPVASLTLGDDQFPALGAVDLSFGGRKE